MDTFKKEIMKFWNEDDLVTINDELLHQFDLSQDTKMILSSIGLPINAEDIKEDPFYINFYEEPKMELGNQGDDYVILGDNEGCKIGIYSKTDNLYIIDIYSSIRRFINTDIAKFLMFLKIYLSYRPHLVRAMEVEDDEEKVLKIVDNIKQKFNQLDSKALLDEESYWPVILEQVEDGLSC